MITYLRLSVTDSCNMSCNYCSCKRPGGPSSADTLNQAEISRLVEALAAAGVQKVRLTGGEPLLRSDICSIASTIRTIPGISTLSLTTNGVGLASAAGELASAGVDTLTISIDSLDSATFKSITGRDALGDVLKGLETSLKWGFERVKVNTVVMRGINEHELPAIADLARNVPVDVRFIELMPVGSSVSEWRRRYVSAREIRGILDREMVRLPREPGSPAVMYETPGFTGRIGVIAPMSKPFCSECNRIRITCTGILKPCLRSAESVDLRRLLERPNFEARIKGMLSWIDGWRAIPAFTRSDAVSAESMSAIGG